MSTAKRHRKLHRWGAILTLVPAGILFATGVLLQLKKDWSWIQPPTQRGTTTELAISWEDVLAVTSSVPEAEVSSWTDIDRVDVRPDRGMMKVRCNNDWEVQLDAVTGEVLSSTLRRSDLIESIHDGSFFHDKVKLWVWLPSAFVLCGMWFTGLYLWWLPHAVKRRRKRESREA